MARVTVKDYERVVRMLDGRVLDVLGPGRHRYRRRRTTLYPVDTRPRLLTAAQNTHEELCSAAQLALREAVTGLTLDALLAGRSGTGAELAENVRPTAARLGMDVAEPTVRDVMLPGELRRAYAEVLLAQQRGRAELERARSEAAALRTLANVARLLDEHPALLHLRTLQHRVPLWWSSTPEPPRIMPG